MQEGFKTDATTRLEVCRFFLSLEICQSENAILSYRIEIPKGSVCMQAHHSLRMCLKDFVL